MSDKTLDNYLETLRRIVNTLGPQHSFHASLRKLLRTLAERHDFLRPHLVIYDPEARTLRLCLADTAPNAADTVCYEPGVGITGQVFTLGRSVIVERISGNTVFQNKFFTRTPREMDTLAFLCVPVFAVETDPSEGQEVVGVLSMDTPVAPRPVLESQCRFLEVVAGLVGHQVSYLQEEMTRRQLTAAPGAEAREVTLPSSVVAISKKMRLVLHQVVQAGASRLPVLLRGESGTGKELLAEVLHSAGPRRELPLVRVNCATLRADTLEADLFGVRKGGLPGALQTSKGLLETAHKGTVYLSSVELLPDAAQERLLHVMQDHELLRVGGGRPVAVDVLVICGTQRSREDLQREGGLREDLLRRLSGLTIEIPPLREHAEDIMPLAEHFLLLAAGEQGKSIRRISAPAMELLQWHTWPGNVRELKSCLERAVAVCEEDVLRAWHLPASLQTCGASPMAGISFSEAVSRFEKELLVDALQKARGNMLEASRLLDTSYRIINYKVKKYGLDPKKFTLR